MRVRSYFGSFAASCVRVVLSGKRCSAMQCLLVCLAFIALGLAAQAFSSPRILYAQNDQLGTTRALYDDSRRVVWQANYSPFGEVQVDEDPDGDGARVTFQLRFPGQYEDVETGLYYNYFRDYDPGVGRYVQSDPIGLIGGLNIFAYVGGNPLIYIDPFGLERKTLQDLLDLANDAREVEYCLRTGEGCDDLGQRLAKVCAQRFGGFGCGPLRTSAVVDCIGGGVPLCKPLEPEPEKDEDCED